MKKRFALVLVLAMLMSCVPAFAFATEEDGQGTPAVTEESGQEVAGESGTEDTIEDGTVIDEEPEETTPTYKNEVVTEGGKLVYYNASGAKDMSKGWKRASNGTYYSNGSAIVTSPTRIAGTTTVTKKVKYYWNKKKKKWQTKKKKRAKTKYKTVKKTVATNNLYNFGTDGKLITKSGVYTYNGNEYYGLGGGAIKTGWAAVGDNAMYFYGNGRMAKNTTVGYLKIPANGRLGRAYALGVRKLDSTKWTLKQAYKNSYKLKYKGRKYRAPNAETYAIRGFTKGYGNCYVMASTFYIQAKLLGYDVHQVKGKVAHIFPHSWTVIRQGGKEWVYDPNFKNETRRSGWKIWYGKKGTWRYTNYSKMN